MELLSCWLRSVRRREAVLALLASALNCSCGHLNVLTVLGFNTFLTMMDLGYKPGWEAVVSS